MAVDGVSSILKEVDRMTKTITEKIHPDHPKMSHKFMVQVEVRKGGPGPMWTKGATYETIEEAERACEDAKEQGNFLNARVCDYRPISNQVSSGG